MPAAISVPPAVKRTVGSGDEDADDDDDDDAPTGRDGGGGGDTLTCAFAVRGSTTIATSATPTVASRFASSRSSAGSHSGVGSAALAFALQRSIMVSACGQRSSRVYASPIRQKFVARCFFAFESLNAAIASLNRPAFASSSPCWRA